MINQVAVSEEDETQTHDEEVIEHDEEVQEDQAVEESEPLDDPDGESVDDEINEDGGI